MKIDPELEKISDCLYRVAVKAVIIKGEKVLLLRDYGDIGWTFPGGGVDVGEAATEALTRELCEEIGVSEKDIVILNDILPSSIGHIKKGIPRLNLHFRVNLLSESVKPTQETEALEWVNISEIKNVPIDPSAGDRDNFINVAEKCYNLSANS